MTLPSRYSDFKIVHMISNNEFLGIVNVVRYLKDAQGRYDHKKMDAAIYGWSKGGTFMVYLVDSGHLQKIGTLKRAEVLDEEPDFV